MPELAKALAKLFQAGLAAWTLYCIPPWPSLGHKKLKISLIQRCKRTVETMWHVNSAWHRKCGVVDNRRSTGPGYLGLTQVQQRGLLRMPRGHVARCRARLKEVKCFSLLLPLLTKLWNVQEMNELLQGQGCVAKRCALCHGEGAAAPSFGLLHTAEHFHSALAELQSRSALPRR